MKKFLFIVLALAVIFAILAGVGLPYLKGVEMPAGIIGYWSELASQWGSGQPAATQPGGSDVITTAGQTATQKYQEAKTTAGNITKEVEGGPFRGVLVVLGKRFPESWPIIGSLSLGETLVSTPVILLFAAFAIWLLFKISERVTRAPRKAAQKTISESSVIQGARKDPWTLFVRILGIILFVLVIANNVSSVSNAMLGIAFVAVSFIVVIALMFVYQMLQMFADAENVGKIAPILQFVIQTVAVVIVIAVVFIFLSGTLTFALVNFGMANEAKGIAAASSTMITNFPILSSFFPKELTSFASFLSSVLQFASFLTFGGKNLSFLVSFIASLLLLFDVHFVRGSGRGGTPGLARTGSS